MSSSSRPLGFWTATALVVANMVGTGVFTSLGFQVQAVPSAFGALSLWVIGGLLAACGALVYAELASAMPRSGGEYLYLSELFHPSVGFLSGFVSATVAFAAPAALSALAFGNYMTTALPGFSPKWGGLSALLLVSGFHLFSGDRGARFLNISTLVKLLPVVAFIGLGFWRRGATEVSFIPTSREISLLWSAPFAVSLVYVAYAYSGWNASTYLAGEVRSPQKTVPRSILTACVSVTVLYVALNAVFLRIVPLADLSGTVEVGSLAGEGMFGPLGRRAVGMVVGLGLLSSIGSFLMAGAGLVKAMGTDFPRLRWLAKTTASGNPRVALLTQGLIAGALYLTSTFESVLTFIGFVLTVFTTLAVLGVFRLRFLRRSGPYRTWGYPLTPLIFLGFNLWMMIFLLRDRPGPSLWGVGLLLVGGLLYWVLGNPERAAQKVLPDLSADPVIR